MKIDIHELELGGGRGDRPSRFQRGLSVSEYRRSEASTEGAKRVLRERSDREPLREYRVCPHVNILCGQHLTYALPHLRHPVCDPVQVRLLRLPVCGVVG